ncbi:MAG: hypothetical protein ACREIA_10790 [Opitutaceae bacterium]
MPDTTFALTRFENRNGKISWRISGWLAGIRIRKNFKSREEAAAEKAALELKTLQVTSGLRSTTTFLTDEQLREAEAAFRRLTDRPKPLSFYLDYAFANYREPTREHPLADAIAAYLTLKQQEHDQHVLSRCQLTSVRRHLTVLKSHFPKVMVAELSADRLAAFCQRGNASPKTYNNRRGVVSTFLKFALQKDWIAANPIEKVPHRRIAPPRFGPDSHGLPGAGVDDVR